jgi:hypothetical protein
MLQSNLWGKAFSGPELFYCPKVTYGAGLYTRVGFFLLARACEQAESQQNQDFA